MTLWLRPHDSYLIFLSHCYLAIRVASQMTREFCSSSQTQWLPSLTCTIGKPCRDTEWNCNALYTYLHSNCYKTHGTKWLCAAHPAGDTLSLCGACMLIATYSVQCAYTVAGGSCPAAVMTWQQWLPREGVCVHTLMIIIQLAHPVLLMVLCDTILCGQQLLEAHLLFMRVASFTT